MIHSIHQLIDVLFAVWCIEGTKWVLELFHLKNSIKVAKFQLNIKTVAIISLFFARQSLESCTKYGFLGCLHHICIRIISPCALYTTEEVSLRPQYIKSNIHAEKGKDGEMSRMRCWRRSLLSFFVTSRCRLSASPALVLSPLSSGPLPPFPLSPDASLALSPPAGFFRPEAPCTFEISPRRKCGV